LPGQALAIAEATVHQTDLFAPFCRICGRCQWEEFSTGAASQSIVTLEKPGDRFPETWGRASGGCFSANLDIGQEHAVQFGFSWRRKLAIDHRNGFAH